MKTAEAAASTFPAGHPRRPAFVWDIELYLYMTETSRNGEPKVEKAQLRGLARARRDAIAPKERTAWSQRAAYLAAGRFPAPSNIGLYMPMDSEFDPRPLAQALAGPDTRLCLPVVRAKATSLRFRRWQPGEALLPHVFGTFAPGPDVPELVPDLLLVPLLAFDRDFYRLGYGGGFYDRTLAELRASGGPVFAIGVGFSAQRMDAVPRGPYDEPLDAIVTEDGIVLP